MMGTRGIAALVALFWTTGAGGEVLRVDPDSVTATSCTAVFEGQISTPPEVVSQARDCGVPYYGPVWMDENCQPFMRCSSQDALQSQRTRLGNIALPAPGDPERGCGFEQGHAYNSNAPEGTLEGALWQHIVGDEVSNPPAHSNADATVCWNGQKDFGPSMYGHVLQNFGVGNDPTNGGDGYGRIAWGSYYCELLQPAEAIIIKEKTSSAAILPGETCRDVHSWNTHGCNKNLRFRFAHDTGLHPNPLTQTIPVFTGDAPNGGLYKFVEFSLEGYNASPGWFVAFASAPGDPEILSFQQDSTDGASHNIAQVCVGTWDGTGVISSDPDDFPTSMAGGAFFPPHVHVDRDQDELHQHQESGWVGIEPSGQILPWDNACDFDANACVSPIYADLDGDGIVQIGDFGAFAACWGHLVDPANPHPCDAADFRDVNPFAFEPHGDGVVGIGDFGHLALRWGRGYFLTPSPWVP